MKITSLALLTVTMPETLAVAALKKESDDVEQKWYQYQKTPTNVDHVKTLLIRGKKPSEMIHDIGVLNKGVGDDTVDDDERRLQYDDDDVPPSPCPGPGLPYCSPENYIKCDIGGGRLNGGNVVVLCIGGYEYNSADVSNFPCDVACNGQCIVAARPGTNCYQPTYSWEIGLSPIELQFLLTGTRHRGLEEFSSCASDADLEVIGNTTKAIVAELDNVTTVECERDGDTITIIQNASVSVPCGNNETACDELEFPVALEAEIQSTLSDALADGSFEAMLQTFASACDECDPNLVTAVVSLPSPSSSPTQNVSRHIY
jgi:hypothetical protein